MLVKCSFGDDIRRFTIDHPFTTFSGLEHQLSNLYKIPRGSFRIFYTDNEGDKILISTNEELSAAVAQANGPNILRLTIETIENAISEDETKFANEDSKELPSTSSFTVPVFSLRDFLPTSNFSANQSIGTNTQVGANNASTNTNSPQVISSSTNTRMLNLMNMGTNTKKSETTTTGTEPYSRSVEDIDMDELFSNPKFQERLATILAHAIATRTFSQLLQNMIPQMTEILKESIKATSTSISSPSIDQIEVEMKQDDENQYDEIPPNISITESSSFSSSTGSEDSFEIDLPEISENNFEDESNMEYENNMEEDEEEYTFEEETPVDANPPNEEPIFQGSVDSPTTTEEPQVLYQNEEEETATEVDEPEQFVIVENSKPEEKKENSPFHSFLSLFKSSQKKTSQPRDAENLEDVEIPNLEDLLTQLESMGFTDKEQNIKALRFHKRFNEGIDEVVEELLQQS